MPIATFRRHDLPAGFATNTHYFKIERTQDTIVLIDMTCSHRGGPLTHGKCDGKFVICPWHTGKTSRCHLERHSQPIIIVADLVMFVVDSVVNRVFHDIPIDCTWKPLK